MCCPSSLSILHFAKLYRGSLPLQQLKPLDSALLLLIKKWNTCTIHYYFGMLWLTMTHNIYLYFKYFLFLLNFVWIISVFTFSFSNAWFCLTNNLHKTAVIGCFESFPRVSSSVHLCLVSIWKGCNCCLYYIF